MRSSVSLLAVALLTSSMVAAADGPVRELRVVPYYSVEPGSHWITAPHPEMTRRPTVVALAAGEDGRPVPDFGVSFDCAVRSTGAVDDCRPMASVPAGVDVATTVALLAPAIRLDQTTVAVAKANGYRVTFDAALMDFPPPPPPLARCPGVACGRDPPPPPPAPPQPADPVLAFALVRGHACYDAAWARMSIAADAADAAIRAGAPPIGTPAYRDLALDYVACRQDLARCVDGLRRTQFATPKSPEDGRVYDVHLYSMVDGYRQTDRDLIAVLAGALDRRAAEAERATSF